jgi:hypothetical protein
MYACGIPLGIFVDSRGPRPAIFAGALLMGLGYFGLHQAYVSGSGHIVLLCLLSFLSGLGGCMAFNSTLKVATLNWPRHRGTATGFPLAAFGLSAFFYSACGYLFFPGDPGAFLVLLTYGTSSLAFIGCLFLRVIPGNHYEPIASSSEGAASGSEHEILRRKSSEELKRSGPGPKHGFPTPEAGTSSRGTSPRAGLYAVNLSSPGEETIDVLRYSQGLENPQLLEAASNPDGDTQMRTIGLNHEGDGESIALLSGPSSPVECVKSPVVDISPCTPVDIRGLQLLREPEFWRIWTILSIVAGIGLMTIK